MNHGSWDERYRSVPRMFSTDPNPTLVTEAASLTAGHALDVGCGEGGDALWLAEHGWTVTAIDVSPTALQRAARADSSQSEHITWLDHDIASRPPPAGPYDLVTMHFVPLLTRDADRVVPTLLNAVAEGGTFLFVTHDLEDLSMRDDFDPRLYCQPVDIARRLDPEWTITVDEKRRRDDRTQHGTSHRYNAVLSCTRLA